MRQRENESDYCSLSGLGFDLAMAMQPFHPSLEIRQTMTAPDCLQIKSMSIVGNNNVQTMIGFNHLYFHFRCGRMTDHIVQSFFDGKQQGVPHRPLQCLAIALDGNTEMASDIRVR